MFSVALAVRTPLTTPSRMLSGTQPCGVRTFLPRRLPCGRLRQRPSGRLHEGILRVHMGRGRGGYYDVTARDAWGRGGKAVGRIRGHKRGTGAIGTHHAVNVCVEEVCVCAD